MRGLMPDGPRDQLRAGETALNFDPAQRDGGPPVAFIGHISSPWSPEDCPKNIRQARLRGGAATLHLKPGYGVGLSGLDVGQPILVLYWMHQRRRDVVVQSPRHADGPRGTFSLRSPMRPNPIALACVRITTLDAAAGKVGIDTIDCYNGTPLLDIKP